MVNCSRSHFCGAGIMLQVLCTQMPVELHLQPQNMPTVFSTVDRIATRLKESVLSFPQGPPWWLRAEVSGQHQSLVVSRTWSSTAPTWTWMERNSIQKSQTGEMAEQLKVFVTIPKDQVQFPAPTQWLTNICNYGSMRRNTHNSCGLAFLYMNAQRPWISIFIINRVEKLTTSSQFTQWDNLACCNKVSPSPLQTLKLGINKGR